MRDAIENVVIGGGPAGSMLAIRLASAGREVLLLERERQPHHKVCGEFLSHEAVAYLRQSGIDTRSLGAREIRRVRLQVGNCVAEAKLPFPALSLSRRVLDECLLQQAVAAGSAVRRGVSAEKLERTNGGWLVSMREAEVLEARTVFLATGKHDVRGHERSCGLQNELIGFKLHLDLSAAQLERLHGVMDLFLFTGGYGGLALVENDTANLCLVVERSRLRKLGGWTELFASIRSELQPLNDRLSGSVASWAKPLAISPIPYGYLAAPTDGLWRLGDQIAVIPSFTGDGMSIAMHSAALAAHMFLAGNTPDAYADCLANQLRPGMRFASLLSGLMVTSAGRALAPSFLRILPRAMDWIARSTRIPEGALLNGSPSTSSVGYSQSSY